MKQTPILFQGNMIRALMNTKPGVWPAEPIDPALPFKWQTRRVMKIQPDGVSSDGTPFKYKKIAVVRDHAIEHIERPDDNPNARFVDVIKCPHGQVGDQLWVRETWDFVFWDTNSVIVMYGADGQQSRPIVFPEGWDPMLYNYQRWRPSIFMPRWASRFTLEIKDIRVERVNEISLDDILAEGCPITRCDEEGSQLEQWYVDLWETIHGDKNPFDSTWVWVISFMVLSK